MITLQKARMATALAGATMLLAAGAAPALAGDDVRVRDACEPDSFNAAIGEGTCVRGDDSGPRVTIDRLAHSVMKSGKHGQWSFTKKAKIDEGDDLLVTFDRGGEAHTFTEVAAFGGPGCVPDVNAWLGLDGFAPECSTFGERIGSPATGPGPEYIGPGVEEKAISGLSAGDHRFICLIHPWMQSTVTVEED
jgi:hypothetical protein